MKAVGKYYDITTAKTALTIRKSFIPDNMTAVLIEWKKQCQEDAEFEESDFIWWRKRPIPETTAAREFNRLIELAELPKITIHGLRHSHDSYLNSIGIGEYEIAAISGRTPEQTKNYIHAYTESLKSTVNKIGKTIKKK